MSQETVRIQVQILREPLGISRFASAAGELDHPFVSPRFPLLLVAESHLWGVEQ